MHEADKTAALLRKLAFLELRPHAGPESKFLTFFSGWQVVGGIGTKANHWDLEIFCQDFDL